MLTKLYWITRISGYVACLGGNLLYLYHQPDAAPGIRNAGLACVGFGFVAFFISYAIRAWLRFGFGRKPSDEEAP